MKKLARYILIMGLLVAPLLSFAKDVFVNGYTRKDGSYVPSHYRSSPNSSKHDNWSTKGNFNPYTGKEGTKKVDDWNTNTDDNSDQDSD